MAIKIDSSKISQHSSSDKQSVSSASGATEFKSILKTARLDIFNGTMNELVAEVKTRGEKFLRNPEEGLLNSYKESIKLFLKRLKDEFLSLKEEFGAPNDGEQKIFMTVNTCESEVSNLTREALTETKALGFLASLDDIRGLVLDVLG